MKIRKVDEARCMYCYKDMDNTYAVITQQDSIYHLSCWKKKCEKALNLAKRNMQEIDTPKNRKLMILENLK